VKENAETLKFSRSATGLLYRSRVMDNQNRKSVVGFAEISANDQGRQLAPDGPARLGLSLECR